MSNSTRWTIIGGGNGGQSLAGHLSLMGYPVRLYDIVSETVDAIRALGGIHVDGVVEGFGKLELVTEDLGQAVRGADAIMVVTPANAHAAVARACADHLVDGQVVILHPGATCGAIEFSHLLRQHGCGSEVAVAETNSLIYACRVSRPGHASILGIKQDLVVATLPVAAGNRVLAMLQEAFPQVVGGKNVMQTSIGNANAVVHPAPTLLNTSLIESPHDWLYYWDGITPTIGAFVETIDQERIDLARALGIPATPIVEWYGIAYGVQARTLSEAVRNNPAYAKVKGQKRVRTRYLLEDIPTGLVPMIELGRKVGAKVERMELIARLGGYLLEEDFFESGRTLQRLGLEDMSGEEIMAFVETGHT